MLTIRSVMPKYHVKNEGPSNLQYFGYFGNNSGTSITGGLILLLNSSWAQHSFSAHWACINYIELTFNYFML